MLTRSNIYEQFAERIGIQTETIIKITISATEYFFSYRPMPKGLNTNPIYPILNNVEGIEESIDIYSKQLRYDSISISLSDIPFYPNTNDRPFRPSELLTQINGAVVDIYFMAGDQIEDIDDCLHVFSGYISTAPQLSRNLFLIEAQNKIKVEDVVIPSRVIQDEISNTPTEFKNIPIPLIYGRFHVGLDKDWLSDVILDYTGTGLAKGIPTNNTRYSQYIFADHDIFIENVFFNLGGPTVVWIEYPSYTYTGPNSLLLARPEALELICSLIFPIDATLPGIYDHESYTAVNPAKAETFNFQYATMKDNFFDNTSTMGGRGLWAFEHPELFAKHLTSATLIKAHYIKLVAKAGVTITHIDAYLYYGREDAIDQKIQIGQKSGAIPYGGGEIDNTGVNIDDLVSSLLEEYVFAFDVTSSALGQGDSILNNQDMLDVDRLYIKLCWTLKERPDDMWAAAEGEYYGGWIQAGGRSNPGGFTSTRHLEHLIYIIEAMYRNHLGLGDDDIDTASFDDAYEEILEGRVNILDQQPISEYVRQLCEQSTFAICHSSTGKVRAVKFNNPSPEIAATIERHHVINDDMKVVKLSRLINDLTVHSNWHGEYGKFLDRDTYEDADSITAHGTRSAEYKWENISEEAAEHVAEVYVNSVDGLWSKEHIEATFSTFGLLHSHLEVGDWIALSTDLDDLRAPFGGTWYGKSLLITKIKKQDTETEITAVEIIAFEYSPEPSPSPSPEPSPSPVEDGLWLINDWDPATSTLNTGYFALLDGIYNIVACRPFTWGPSVGIDMGEEATLSSLRLYDTGYAGCGPGLKTGAQLKLYISNDNESWDYIETFTSMTRVATGGVADPYYIDCIFTSDQTARYFKLYSPSEPLKSAAGYVLDLSELEPTEASPSPSPSP